jgi:hypothetical protein
MRPTAIPCKADAGRCRREDGAHCSKVYYQAHHCYCKSIVCHILAPVVFGHDD